MKLKVEFEMRVDGDVVMRCIREDDSTTWQRNARNRARMHDSSAPTALTDAQLRAIRDDVRALQKEWTQTPPGGVVQTQLNF